MPGDDERQVEQDPAPSHDDTARLDDARLAGLREAISGVSTFRAGQVLGGRYLVRRLVATGGMGEVYEVEDNELGERVALKTLKVAAYPDQVTRDRFKREIQLSRRVTHPNVCRVHDTFTHVVTAPDGREIDELACVTMELLEGETLTRKMERDGPLPLSEAFELVRQMADGLAAAHDAGIVHRDFKPGNVILVPMSGGRTRAVITDFGLARRVDGVHDHTLTETGMVVGTPAYMPPEQLEGKPVTPATDIYALGVVIYEMVTGARPFAGETPISLAVQRLHTLPESPAVRRRGLGHEWEKAILRCLEPDPAARFVDVRDVVRALEGKPVAKGSARARNRTTRRKRFESAGVTMLFVLALVAAIVGVRHLASRTQAPPATSEIVRAAVSPRRAAAVFGLKNLSGSAESAWLSSALAEMLRTEMAAGESIRLVSGEDIARAKMELGLPDADSFSPDTLAKLRDGFGASLVLVGSYVVVPQAGSSELRVDIRLQDAENGETVLAVGQTGSDRELLALVATLGSQLRSHLGTGTLTAEQGRALEASRPANREALRLYAEGLDALRSYDALTARDLLRQAVELDPAYPMAHAALADAWATLGYDSKALEAATRARELAVDLDRQQKMQLEARFHEASSNWKAAADVYGALYSFFPDSLDYGLSLIQAETFNGNYERCEEILAELQQLPGSMASDPKIDLVAAALYRARGGFERVASAAESAIRKGEERGADLLVARAKLHLGWALREMSRFEEAERVLDEAKAALEQFGDRGGAAEAEMLQGAVLFYAGRPDDGTAHFAAATVGCREVGWKKCESHALGGIGGFEYQKGRVETALDSYRRSLGISRDIGDRTYGATTLGNIAQCETLNGNPRAGLDSAEEVLAEVALTGQEYLRYVGEYGKGLAYRELGDLAKAHAHFTSSLNFARANRSTRYEAFALTQLGEVDAWRGDLDSARRNLEAALAIQVASKEISTAELTRARLATVSIWSGDAGETVETLQRSVKILRETGNAFFLAEAEVALVDALLTERNVAGARVALDRLKSDATGLESPQQLMAIELAEARVLAGEGERDRALTLAGEVANRARNRQLMRVAYLAETVRVTIARSDPTRGQDAENARAALLESADRDGFGLVRILLER